jgi:hypothetical protein
MVAPAPGRPPIDTAEHTEHDRVDKDDLPLIDTEYGQPELRQAGRYRANPAYLIQVEQHQGGQGDDDQRGQLRRDVTGQPGRHQEQDGDCGNGQQGFTRLDAGHQLGQILQHADDPAGRHGLAERGSQLQDDQDDADAGHETRYHGIRHQGDVLAETQHAQQDLEQPGKDNDREGHGHAIDRIGGDQLGDNGREDHGHRARRLGHQAWRTAEQRGKQPDEYRTVEPGLRAGTRGNAEGQRHRQGNHRGRDATKYIAANILQVYFVEQLHAIVADRQTR